MEKIKRTQFLTLEVHDEIGVLWLDLPGEEWNKVTLGMVSDFESTVNSIEKNDTIKAVVIISGKKGFMAGADIEEFLKMGPGEAKKTALVGHQLFARLEDSKKPIVVAVHGACMGGGTEISLSCASRIATNDPSTVFGLPEVKLGLLPGLGGTFRLPKLVGIQKALDMMLTGKNIYAHQALKMGLVDKLVAPPKLLEAAKKQARSILEGTFNRKSKLSFTESLLQGNPIGRNIIFNQATKLTLRATRSNYPAPIQIINSVKDGWGKSREAAAEQEAEKFDRLMQSPESRQLINLFFAMNALKKNPLKDKVRKVDALGILGAGLMGEGIAEVSLPKNIDIKLKDIDQKRLTDVKKRIYSNLQKKVKYKTIQHSDAERLIQKINGSLQNDFLSSADIVIEAVFEDLDLKHKVLAEVEAVITDDCIFASNTSALPIGDIAAKAKIPERVIGMHYFSPVQKMPLLEIITTPKTADWVTATALDLGIRQGKTCIVVKDGPGFYTTRILAPYMNEALLLLEEKAEILQLDSAMKNFGFPVGPMTLMDEVGIDVGAHINRGALRTFFDARGAESSNMMAALEKAGFKGKKNGLGFLKYDPKTGKKLRNQCNAEIYEHCGGSARIKMEENVIQQRMAFMMINEAALCLQEGIIANPRDGDIGAIFGLGFPPFLGGPFRYLDALTPSKFLKNSESLQHLGKRFTPAQIIIDYEKENRTFYNK